MRRPRHGSGWACVLLPLAAAACGNDDSDDAGSVDCQAEVQRIATEAGFGDDAPEIGRMAIVRGDQRCLVILECMEAAGSDDEAVEDCFESVGGCSYDGDSDTSGMGGASGGLSSIECHWTGPTSYTCQCDDTECTGETSAEAIDCTSGGDNCCE